MLPKHERQDNVNDDYKRGNHEHPIEIAPLVCHLLTDAEFGGVGNGRATTVR